jgi:hypothetical protein
MDRRNKPPSSLTNLKLILSSIAFALAVMNILSVNPALILYWSLVGIYWFVNALL